MLLRVAMSLTPQPADAHDLVQDALLRSWRSFETFDGRHPRAWLLTILRNANLNSHRKPRPDPIDPADASRSLGGEVSASAEDHVVDPLFGATIESALADLKPEARQLVMLVDADGLSYAEAAAVLGVPEGTVMSRLHRARKKIKKRVVAAGAVAGAGAGGVSAAGRPDRGGPDPADPAGPSPTDLDGETGPSRDERGEAS